MAKKTAESPTPLPTPTPTPAPTAGVSAASTPYAPTRARCGQCGKELRHVPFTLNNIMCRECYGLERYRRGGGGPASAERAASAAAAAAQPKKEEAVSA